MSLLYIDGFDSYDTAHLPARWTDLGSGMTGSGGGIGSTVSRSGGQALFLTLAAANTKWAGRTFPATASWVIGFAFRYTAVVGSAAPLCSLFDAGNNQCELRLNTDASLAVTRTGLGLTGGTSSSGLAPNTWYYIEWKVTISDSIGANSCKVRVNGADVITVATGQDVKSTANASATALRLGPAISSGTGTWYYDDVYVCDNAGSVNNDFLGDVKVERLLPTGNGNVNQWTPSGAFNYGMVSDAPPDDDATYVGTSTVGNRDLYAMGNLLTSPSSIKGVQTCILARKTDVGARNLSPLCRSGGTTYAGAPAALADTYSYLTSIRETDPATGVAWTETAVNAMEAGVELTS